MQLTDPVSILMGASALGCIAAGVILWPRKMRDITSERDAFTSLKAAAVDLAPGRYVKGPDYPGGPHTDKPQLPDRGDLPAYDFEAWGSDYTPRYQVVPYPLLAAPGETVVWLVADTARREVVAAFGFALAAVGRADELNADQGADRRECGLMQHAAVRRALVPRPAPVEVSGENGNVFVERAASASLNPADVAKVVHGDGVTISAPLKLRYHVTDYRDGRLFWRVRDATEGTLLPNVYTRRASALRAARKLNGTQTAAEKAAGR